MVRYCREVPDPAILVIAATGKTGRRVVDLLTGLGTPVRAASRTGPVRFDWSDEGTWEAALDGAGSAYVVDPALLGETPDPKAGEVVAKLAETARTRGVSRLVLLSARDLGRLGSELVASETAVMNAGVDWTILRPTWFMQNFSEDLFVDAVAADELRLPAADGHEPFLDLDDLAAVAAAVLTQDGHAGKVYELSGPRLLSFGDVTDEIGRVTGREIAYVPVRPDEYRAGLISDGMSAEFAGLQTKLLQRIGEGRNADLSDGVTQVLKREPRDLTAYVRDAAARGAWSEPGGSSARR